ncbi:hypothetical protein AAVH_15994 [Aphelenchoides avenae]|nr:hypothetical protein AAVH_15993 [Aphelenchus avenae]KAH7716598.1 hypothetical protein AAVH_15994 [Aphelenchus avenae]
MEFPDPNETLCSASSSGSRDEHIIPGLIAYYRAKPGAAVKQKALAIILETTDARMESHMGEAHFATTLVEELRRVGTTPGPAYDGHNHEGEDGPELEPAVEALQLEVNTMKMTEQAQSWNGVSKIAGTGEMPFSQ